MCYRYEFGPIEKFPDSVTYTRIAKQLAKKGTGTEAGVLITLEYTSLKVTPEDL